jgi:hypothetical protein
MKTVLVICVCTLFTVIGIRCLFWPHKVQGQAIRATYGGRFNPLFGFMHSRLYVLGLRFCGLLFIIGSIVFLWIGLVGTDRP